MFLHKIIDTINSSEKDKSKIIKPKKFHNLRHTYATRLFELGEVPKTLDTYTHVLEDVKFMVASKLNDLYISMRAK